MKILYLIKIINIVRTQNNDDTHLRVCMCKRWGKWVGERRIRFGRRVRKKRRR